MKPLHNLIASHVKVRSYYVLCSVEEVILTQLSCYLTINHENSNFWIWGMDLIHNV